MVVNQLSSPEKYKVEYLAGVIKIYIPGQKKSRQLWSLGGWLLYWLIIFAILSLFGHALFVSAKQGTSFDSFTIVFSIALLFGFLSWGLHGYLAAYSFLWRIAGLETLVVSRSSLKIRKSIFGIGRTREFDRETILSIHLGDEVIMPFAFTKFKGTTIKIPIYGPIFVELAKRTIHLGLGLDIIQAEKVVAIIQNQLNPGHA